MQNKFTPGPWWVTDHGVRDKGGHICETKKAFRYPDQDERYAKEVEEKSANARLIAAAPDLFNLVQTFVRMADGRRISGALILDEHSPIMDAARDAITKATGAAT